MRADFLPLKWFSVLELDFQLPTFMGENWIDRIRMTIAALEQHILTSPHIRNLIVELPKGPGTSCPNSPVEEIVKYLATLNAQVDKSDPEVNLRLARNFVRPVFEFERRCMMSAIGGTNLPDHSLNFFRLATQLAYAIDQLYLTWYGRQAILHLKLTAGWSDADKKAHADRLRGLLGGQFDYTVFDYDPKTDTVKNRQTWAEAFPGIIDEIREKLGLMAVYCDNSETSTYLLTLADAYECAEIKKLEERWAAVDRAWIKIPNTAAWVPVHGMENYEHPVGVSPEFRLAVRTDIGHDIIDEVRNTVLAHARASGGIASHLVELAERKLRETMDIAVFTDALRGGTCLRIRISGQVVPNRQDILAEGGKNFLNPEGIGTAVSRSHSFLRQHCTPETAETLIPLVTFKAVLADVVSHECTHPIGCTPEVEDLLGNRPPPEEAKATIGGLAAICAVDSDQAHHSLAVSVARVCRFLSKEKRGDSDSQDYVRENIVMARLLFESGVMRLTEEGLEVNADDLINVDGWIDTMDDFYRRVVRAYHADDPKAAVANLEDIFCPTDHPDIRALIAWLDRPAIENAAT